MFSLSSATWPPGVQRMADQYMTDPVRVFVGSLDLNVSIEMGIGVRGEAPQATFQHFENT